MNIQIFTEMPFGRGEGNLHPTGVSGLVLRVVVGAGFLVWGLAIWKVADLFF